MVVHELAVGLESLLREQQELRWERKVKAAALAAGSKDEQRAPPADQGKDTGTTGAAGAVGATPHQINASYPGLRWVHKDPPVCTVDGFLTPSECRRLRAAAAAAGPDGQVRLAPSPLGESLYTDNPGVRTSHTAYLGGEDERTVEVVRGRIEELTLLPRSQFERAQVARYLPGMRGVDLIMRFLCFVSPFFFQKASLKTKL
jgi:hypothetical protein